MNIIDFNKCELEKCQCGWNVHLGGNDPEELHRLQEHLLQDFDIESDVTDYTKKVTMTKRFDGTPIDRSAN